MKIIMDMYGFYTGQVLNAYEYLGCHYEIDTTVFRTFAPAASKVSVICEFNNWTEMPMQKVYDGNFWECRIPNVKVGMKYKYRIHRSDGFFIDHADPYGFLMEKPPMFSSIVQRLDTYRWSDSKWMKKRTDCKNKPLNIYEIHLGSWKKKENDIWYSYAEIAIPLIQYVKEKGYNYIEIMPIAEHPCDNSWGYQQTGFYSPTARYGTPDELRYLIDYAHQNDVGVILDFVPVHFAVDGYALSDYDGTSLYEYPHTDIKLSEWGSKNFNNSIKQIDSTIMLIAEDSTSYESITKSVSEGGLGFDYKWDMGWMNDTLSYFKTHPYDRKRDYHKLTFSMMYFETENFLLPFSHDEVVHGKATIVQKMNGEYEHKFPQARALYLYMYTHPGKKLNFMGNEIGQLREWNEQREQDWDITNYPTHDSFSRFMKDLNFIYQNNSALYEMDYDKNGFHWIDCHQEEKCIYVYERISRNQNLLIILNFSDQKQNYLLDTSNYTSIELLFATDNEIYGGIQKYDNNLKMKIKEISTDIIINPFTGLLYKIEMQN